FQAIDSPGELEAALRSFGGAGLLKTRRLGYDGKGQAMIRDRTDAPAALAALGGRDLVLESIVPFEREISVVAARGRDGSLAAYDPAENVHRDGILATSLVPARIGPDTAQAARAAAFGLLEALDYVGVIGVEFFVVAGGGLLVNEIAPRVHNSGHWTEAACAVSQFEQHVRAIAGLPLGAPGRHSDCVMENLIGAEIGRLAALAGEADVVVHHYGKVETRPGRKMGHFTRLFPRSSLGA
ncbi:MAG: ATP-grasp domain-containing protein, partial [Rhizobiaceae bacterium]